MISARIKDALQAVKARGTGLGQHGAEHLSVLYRSQAVERAKNLAPVARRHEAARPVIPADGCRAEPPTGPDRWRPQTVMLRRAGLQ